MGIAPQVDHLGFLSGSTSIGALRLTKTSLTNAQIKSLPTASVAISEIPGSAQHIWPISIDIRIVASSGLYTNIDAAAYAWAGSYTASTSPVTVFEQYGYIANDATLTPPEASMDLLFGNASINGCLIQSSAQHRPDPDNWWNLSRAVTSSNTFDALPWHFTVSNGALGDFTGGHASNTGTIWFAYFVI